MKVVFLDFDGVLNSYEFLRQETGSGLDRSAVARLNAIVQRSGAKVVISSTWRLNWPLEALREKLSELGFDGEVIGRTPDLIEASHGDPFLARCLEIQAWIEGHMEPLESFVVIDDAYLEGVAQFLVKTETDTGLLDEHVAAAIEILGELEMERSI